MKRQFILLFTLAFFVLTGHVAWAAGISPEIVEIQVEGDVVEDGETYITKNNLVDIEVECTNAIGVKLNTYSLKESVTASVYYIDNFSLKAGLNKITVQATGSGTTAKKILSINYIASFAEGTKYTSELPATGTISVFGKSVNLIFPKDSVISDDDDEII